jgi:hypothetical protein
MACSTAKVCSSENGNIKVLCLTNPALFVIATGLWKSSFSSPRIQISNHFSGAGQGKQCVKSFK